MDKIANKSVRFGGDTDLKFSKLSEKLGRSKQELFGQMVDYFYKSQKDPGDLNDELLKKELGQGINRIISFIKTQERDTLTPMLADQREVQRDLTRLARQLHSFYNVDGTNMARGHFVSWTIARQHEAEKLAKERADLEEERKKTATTLTNLLAETRSYRNEVQTQAKTKESLKARFRAILDHYILHREALNSLTQGRALRELEENVRSQVDHL
jgi:hypothetical protein